MKSEDTVGYVITFRFRGEITNVSRGQAGYTITGDIAGVMGYLAIDIDSGGYEYLTSDFNAAKMYKSIDEVVKTLSLDRVTALFKACCVLSGPTVMKITIQPVDYEAIVAATHKELLVRARKHFSDEELKRLSTLMQSDTQK